MQEKVKITFVGQTPPPYGGQAIMIEKILQGSYEHAELYHVRMAFSKEMDQIGKASLSKIFHLFTVIMKIMFTRITKGASVLYYPPAGPDKTPVLRDIIILLCTRWMFKRTIFHFHAGGVSQLKLAGALKWLYTLAYQSPDVAILLSELNPPDGKALNAKKEFIVPYGIEDNFEPSLKTNASNSVPVLLFVAIIKETKGILVLLEACKQIKEKGLRFRLEVMGKFESSEFEASTRSMVESLGLAENVTFLGVLSGKDKFSAFGKADVFCFPTFFESETFGVVLLEAMQFSLPLIGTRWRGIPSIINDHSNGLIVEPKNAMQLANAIEQLLKDETLRKTFGQQSRKDYEEHFTLQKFHQQMDQVFRSCA